MMDRQLHEEYAGMVKNLCSSYLHTKEDQEDAQQEILLKLAAMSPPNAVNEAGYIYSLVTNMLKDFIRKERRRVEVEAAAAQEPMVDEDDPLSVLERQSEEEETVMMIADLPLDLRVTAELYYYHGLNYKDIAEELSIPEGTVASRLNKARSILRGEWCENSR